MALDLEQELVCMMFYKCLKKILRTETIKNILGESMVYVVTKKERQMKLTRFIFSRRFEVIVTPLSSDV